MVAMSMAKSTFSPNALCPISVCLLIFFFAHRYRSQNKNENKHKNSGYHEVNYSWTKSHCQLSRINTRLTHSYPSTHSITTIIWLALSNSIKWHSFFSVHTFFSFTFLLFLARGLWHTHTWSQLKWNCSYFFSAGRQMIKLVQPSG